MCVILCTTTHTRRDVCIWQHFIFAGSTITLYAHILIFLQLRSTLKYYTYIYIYFILNPKLNKNFITVKMWKLWKSMSNRSMIIIYIICTYMINLLPLRLIFIRTYERDSEKERLREDVLPRFRVLKCCDFLWTIFNIYYKKL